jgi:hypothetical protein
VCGNSAAIGGADDAIVAVFCRMTSTCQAISRSSRSSRRARATSIPGIDSLSVEMVARALSDVMK